MNADKVRMTEEVIPNVDESNETDSSHNCTKPFRCGLVMACLNMDSLHTHGRRLQSYLQRILCGHIKIYLFAANY